jgi:hypothetical protein
MTEQDIFNGLIATYRELNTKVRPLPEERLTLGHPRESVRKVVLDMRDHELRFSQRLKDRLVHLDTGELLGDMSGDGVMLEVATPADTTAEVISQFGTARESTLAMLRGLAPETWDEPSQGTVTIRGAAGELLASDTKYLEKIVSLLGSPAA